MPCEAHLRIHRGLHERLICTQHRHHSDQGCHGSHLSHIQYIQICANQQIPTTVYHLYGVTVSYRQKIKSNEWTNEHFHESRMPFEGLQPTELIQKVRLPFTNINFELTYIDRKTENRTSLRIYPLFIAYNNRFHQYVYNRQVNYQIYILL